MDHGWRDPRFLMLSGVALLVTGYIVLGDPAAFRITPAVPRVAFFSGLVLLAIGVLTWLQQPPAPDPADTIDEEPDTGDD